MYNLLKIEFMKLKKSKEFRYLFLVVCIISLFLMGHSIYCLEVFIRKAHPEYVITGLETYRELVRGKLYIEVIQNILITVFICNDFENRLVQSEELSGYSRFQILMSKVIICFVIKAFLTFFFVFIDTIGLSILYKLGGILSLRLILKMARMYLLSVLISFGVATSAILTAYIFRILSLSVLVWVGAFFAYLCGGTILGDMFQEAQGLQYFLDHSIFMFYRKLEVNIMLNDIIYITSMSLLRIVIIISITYIVFRKTELK